MKPFSALIGIAAAAICFHSVAQAQKKPKPEAPLPTGLYAIFETSAGTITAKLDEKYAPKSVENFVELAQGTKAWVEPGTIAMVKRPMYNNITFHRVLRGIMIQSGDPSGTGSHNCGFSIPDEILPGVLFDRPGKLAVANLGKPNSGASSSFLSRPTWCLSGAGSTRSSGRW